MPLFNKKFESKSIPARSGRCNIEFPPISEDLDDFEINLNKELHVKGNWLQSNKKEDIDDFGRLNDKIKNLEEENNMNQVKIDVLLDLLTENVSELNAVK
uniref:Uncharacterized protein n=1 Tax=Megaselia scalaris TaxID=36166 RepID=T1H6P3_MEGSC